MTFAKPLPFVVASALACWTALAQAQVGPPVRLIKPDAAPATAPSTAGPSRDPALPPAATAPAAGVDPDKVEVGQLSQIEPGTMGVLTEAQGGFAPDLWKGSRREAVEQLLAALPTESSSRAVRELSRRLLLSGGALPARKPGDRSILGIRVERLIAGGMVAEAHDLLRLARPTADDNRTHAAEVDALLLAEDHSAACTRIRERVRVDDSNAWLQKLAFCQVLAGENAAANLSVGILREQKVDDQPYFRLMQALGGDASIKIENLPKPSPLHFAMLRAARRNVPADAVAGAAPAMLRAIARAPNAPLDVRLRAAERAEAAGSLPAEALAQIYSAVQFKPEQIEAVFVDPPPAPGPQTGALHHQAIELKADPLMRARALQRAWRAGREAGLFATYARVNLKATKDLRPAPELAFVATDAARALLAAGESALAEGWAEVARKTGDLAKAGADLLPLLQIADPTLAPWGEASIAAYWERLKDLPEAQRLGRAAMAFSLFDALGQSVEDAAWMPLLAAPFAVNAAVPSPGLWRVLADASNEGRKGEGVAAALIVLGAPDPKAAHPAAVASAIDALRRFGLEREARAAALEAAIAHGL
jgi:hypothetical protein